MKSIPETTDTRSERAKRLEGVAGQHPFRLRRHSARGRGLQAGLTEDDWAAIRERAYQGDAAVGRP